MSSTESIYNYIQGENHPQYKLNRNNFNQKYYDKNKEAILKKQKEKVECPYCRKLIRRNWKHKHIKQTCKSLENPYTNDKIDQPFL